MSIRHGLSASALALLLTILVQGVAEAQIYYWRDSSGAFVLSDKPKDPSARTYTVQQSASIRSTRRAPRGRAALCAKAQDWLELAAR